jgi:hypothetical protein
MREQWPSSKMAMPNQSWTGGTHGLKRRRKQDGEVQTTPSTDARSEALPGSLRVNHTTTTTTTTTSMVPPVELTERHAANPVPGCPHVRQLIQSVPTQHYLQSNIPSFIISSGESFCYSEKFYKSLVQYNYYAPFIKRTNSFQFKFPVFRWRIFSSTFQKYRQAWIFIRIFFCYESISSKFHLKKLNLR